MKKILLVLIILAGTGVAGITWRQRSAGPSAAFRTAPISRENLLITISATGILQPEEVIDVGAQVAGKIESFGVDPGSPGKPIDYGTAVEKGTVLASIDQSLYAADVEQANAQLEQARANVKRAEADLVQTQAKLHQAERNWARIEGMQESGALSATDYDSYEAAYETAKAAVGVAEATVLQTQKAVLQAEASLRRSQTNLGYCTIKSPVKGVIIDRRVNIGQTVVASLNAPSLFLIAKDLRKMQVWASVNEADIGSIFPGQPVTFTVDAWPGQTFRGTVAKIRLNATMTQNVVTYTVEIATDNADEKLLPYLTANVRFEVTQRENVLTVPNSALRWTPSPEQVVPEQRGSLQSDREPGERRSLRTKPAATQPATGVRPATLWVREGAFARPVDVLAGLSDGLVTEIQGGNLKEGDEVIIGNMGPEQASAGQGGTNPFVPQFMRGGRRGA